MRLTCREGMALIQIHHGSLGMVASLVDCFYHIDTDAYQHRYLDKSLFYGFILEERDNDTKKLNFEDVRIKVDIISNNTIVIRMYEHWSIGRGETQIPEDSHVPFTVDHDHLEAIARRYLNI